MTNKPKQIGTWTETAVVRYLRTNGFPAAERRVLAGSADLGDILGVDGICVEVKGGKAAETCADADLAEWKKQTLTEQRNTKAVMALLVLKRRGKGAASAGDWWAYLPGADFVDLATAPVTDACPPIALGLPWVRLTLADAVHLLRRGGFGTPLEAAA